MNLGKIGEQVCCPNQTCPKKAPEEKPTLKGVKKMKYIIHATFSYKSVKGLPFSSDVIDEDKILFVYEELQKTGRFHTIEIKDERGQYYSVKTIKKNMMKTDSIKEVKVYIDGAFDKQTFKAGEGIVIYYKKGASWYRYRESVFLDFVENNNEAEWLAFEKCIQILEEQNYYTARYVTIYTDSKSTVETYYGNYPIYKESDQRLWDRISNNITKLKLDIDLQYIPRNENMEAHKLSQQGLEKKEHVSHIEVGDYDG